MLFFLSRVTRRIFKVLNVSQKYWYGDWKKNLPSIKTIIIFAPCDLEVMKFIKKVNKEVRVIYWYWNPTLRVGIPDRKISNLAELWSFDPEDCRKFNLNFNTTFYFKNIVIIKSKIEFDVIFLGFNKGRKKYLEELEKLLIQHGIHAHFQIIPDREEDKKNYLKTIPYYEYLKLVSKTKALIDINSIGQSGLTLRAMESIFFKKKLICNDKSIIYQDFYKQENIFILGTDNEEKLKDFINSSYAPLDEMVIEKYDIKNWLARFNN